MFARNGFSGTSVRDISSESGIGLSSIIYHFQTKEKLFLETIRHFTLELGKLNRHFEPLFAADRRDLQAVADALHQAIRSFLDACHGPSQVRDLNELYIRIIAEGNDEALGMLFDCFADVQKRLYALFSELRPDMTPIQIGFLQQLLWSLLQYTVVGKRLILFDMKLQQDYTNEYLAAAAAHFASYCCMALGLPQPRSIGV